MLIKKTLRAKLRSRCRAPLRLPLPPSHCNATTADRTVSSHCVFNTPCAVGAGLSENSNELKIAFNRLWDLCIMLLEQLCEGEQIELDGP